MSKNLDFVDMSAPSCRWHRHVQRLFDPGFPTTTLPKLPPAADLETRAILKACITARSALAELNAAVELIPNPTILINTLPILEARASSEIENIVTTTDRLFRLASDESAATDPATKEALRYRTALWRGAAGLARRPVTHQPGRGNLHDAARHRHRRPPDPRHDAAQPDHRQGRLHAARR